MYGWAHCDCGVDRISHATANYHEEPKNGTSMRSGAHPRARLRDVLTEVLHITHEDDESLARTAHVLHPHS